MNKDELPELPNELDFEQWYCENAFHFERDPIGSRDCELQRKAWHAALAALQAGEPVGYLSDQEMQQLKSDGFAMLEKLPDETAVIPLFTRPQATSEAEAMLAFVLEHGLPEKYMGQKFSGFTYLTDGGSPDPSLARPTRRDAIRAAMKGAGS